SALSAGQKGVAMATDLGYQALFQLATEAVGQKAVLATTGGVILASVLTRRAMSKGLQTKLAQEEGQAAKAEAKVATAEARAASAVRPTAVKNPKDYGWKELTTTEKQQVNNLRRELNENCTIPGSRRTYDTHGTQLHRKLEDWELVLLAED